MRISVTAGTAGSVSAAPRAPRILFGTGAPTSGLGFIGDVYERQTTGEIYLKRASGWVLQGNLTGPAGATGPTGPVGTPRSGTAVPDNGVGANGEVYFRYYDDGAARAWYQKAGDSWGSPHDMRGPARALVTIGRTITTSGAIADSDLGKAIIVDSSSTVTITLPDSLELGFSCMFIRKGTGAVIFAGGGTATLVHPYSHDRIGVRYGVVSVLAWLSATQWSLFGETAAS